MDIVLRYIGHHSLIISLYIIPLGMALQFLYVFTKRIEFSKISQAIETILCILQSIFWIDVGIVSIVILNEERVFFTVLAYILAIIWCLLTVHSFKNKGYAK